MTPQLAVMFVDAVKVTREMVMSVNYLVRALFSKSIGGHLT